MRVRIIRGSHGDVDGIDLAAFQIGHIYDVPTSVGTYLIATHAAELVRAEERTPLVKSKRYAQSVAADESRSPTTATQDGTLPLSLPIAARLRHVSTRAPEWSLSGISVQWPDGQTVVLSQSRWTRGQHSWDAVVSVPRHSPNGARFLAARLHMRDSDREMLPENEGAWVHVRKLIVLRMRAHGFSGDDLGDIVLHL